MKRFIPAAAIVCAALIFTSCSSTALPLPMPNSASYMTKTAQRSSS